MSETLINLFFSLQYYKMLTTIRLFQFLISDYRLKLLTVNCLLLITLIILN